LGDPETDSQLRHKLSDGRRDAPPFLPDDAPLAQAADGRPIIKMGTDVTRMIDEAVEALARTRKVYQRDQLVGVVHEAENDNGHVRSTGAPRIRLLPIHNLWESCCSAAEWQRLDEKKGWCPAFAPMDTVVKALAARGEWDHLPPLNGVVDFPTLKPSGEILSTPGYDPESKVIYEPSLTVSVPESPTREQALEAVQYLLDRVSDFPFETETDRSGWLALVLTLLARPAIDGGAPMFHFDANSRGCGKTMLVELAGEIVLGRPPEPQAAPTGKDEFDKVMLSLAYAAETFVLFDNLTHQLKSDSLDMVLSSARLKGRKLGVTEILKMDVHTVFACTANNGSLSTDLGRRSIRVRLVSRVERPELRDDFKWPNPVADTRRDRAKLVAAGLTILRAFVVAGRPAQSMRGLGSFSSWSNVVRAAMIWPGLPDVALSQDAARESSDFETDSLTEVMHAWTAAFGERVVTCADLLRTASAELREAIVGFCPPTPGMLAGMLPTAKTLTWSLKKNRDRIMSGLVLECVDPKARNGATWRVRHAGARSEMGG
jgi:putative DNA primase/helicase